jgi:translation elongation factor P/translation initiation factor 5A
MAGTVSVSAVRKNDRISINNVVYNVFSVAVSKGASSWYGHPGKVLIVAHNTATGEKAEMFFARSDTVEVCSQPGPCSSSTL